MSGDQKIYEFVAFIFEVISAKVVADAACKFVLKTFVNSCF